MQLKKYDIGCPLIVSTFAEHSNIKQLLLEKISTSESQLVKNSNDLISRTDFYIDKPRDYKDFIVPKLADHMKGVFLEFNIPEFSIGNVWFQQYNMLDKHDWHIHPNCHWTNVYFLELPTNENKTLIKQVLSNSNIEYDAKEGDIITFPSFLYHKSRKNISQEQKTIISFNINFG